jgi:hypothetical protein
LLTLHQDARAGVDSAQARQLAVGGANDRVRADLARSLLERAREEGIEARVRADVSFRLVHVDAVRAAVGSLDGSREAGWYRLIAQATDGPAEVDARQCAQDLGGSECT